MSTWKYLEWNQEQKDAMLNVYGRNNATFKDDVKSIREWLEKQPHLNNYKICDNMIEFYLIFNKFRFDKVKHNIDMYFSLRSYVPEIYDKMENKNLKRVMSVAKWVGFPNLTKDNLRIFLGKFIDTDPNKFDLYEILAYLLKVLEIRTFHDCAIADIIILDCGGSTLSHYLQVTPVLLKKSVAIMKNQFSLRYKAIYFINTPKIAHNAISLLKMFMTQKIAQRIVVCEDSSVLFDLMPRSEIPKDYGGDGPLVTELGAVWDKKCEEYDYWYEMLKKNPVDPKLKPEKQTESELFGMEGNFRKLDID